MPETLMRIGSPQLAVTKKEAIALVRKKSLYERWAYWTRRGQPWIEIVQQGGRARTTLIDYASLVSAYERWKRGEVPPPLPSEERSLARSAAKTAARRKANRGGSR